MLLEQDNAGILTPEAMIVIFDLFASEPDKTALYLCVHDCHLCRTWVRSMLKKMNFLLPEDQAG